MLHSLQAFALLISVTDSAKVPHFDLATDACIDCLKQEDEQVKALSGEIQRAKIERVCLRQSHLSTRFQADRSSFFAGTSKGNDGQGFPREQQRNL